MTDQMSIHEHYSTMRDGLNITNCDSEPVRTPGCVQAHGALLVLRLADLRIVQASDNVYAVLGHTVAALLQQHVSVVIGADGEECLAALLAGQATDCNPLYLLTLPEPGALPGSLDGLDVTAHTIDGVVILEFESTGRLAPVSADAYGVVRKTVALLQTADSLLQLCQLAAAEIRQLTGMDRVMVYKFHEDGHGEIFAESTLPELPSWVGMHYPAQDIPKPARDLFSKTWLRPIPDMSDALAEMVPLANPDTQQALDMTYCYLRGVSKMCTEFYRNMGVAATLTLSIRRGDHLWGLISCTYAAAPRYLSYQVRAACEFLAQVVSVQHNAAEDKEQADYRLTLERVHQQLLMHAGSDGVQAALVHGAPSMLDGIDASGAALLINGRWSRLGTTPEPTQLKALGQWLQDGSAMRRDDDGALCYATDSLVRDYPAAAAYAHRASGMIAIALSEDRRDLMLWFRPETMQTISWGGNPHDKLQASGVNGPRLTPRRSFEAFVESVHQRALPWKAVELAAVRKLRRQLQEVVIASEEQASLLDVELARTNDRLDAFNHVARHDLKEPLRGIRRYAAELTEDADRLHAHERDKLEHMLRLTLRMDGLLDSLLHIGAVGHASLPLETVHVRDIVALAVALVPIPENVQLVLTVAPRLPVLTCHWRWLREIYQNLISNAVRYNRAAIRRVDIGAIAPQDVHPRPRCPDTARHDAIYFVADNGIGIDPDSFDHIFKLFRRLHGRDEYGGGTGTGLTVVRKLVQRHGGQVWLDSPPGTGTTFYFTLPSAIPLHWSN